MRELEHAPHAPALTESMRSVGYSLESAIADLIDNSISASAKNIKIRFSPHDDPRVAIIDDGSGMDDKELVHAMRHGSQNPNVARSANDLGRFGLGMKTASLSQCRELTVVSMKNGRAAAARWDLDVISSTQKWTLLLLEHREIHELPFVDILESAGRGTMVLWRRLDRLEVGEGTIELGLGSGMVRVREHLALVFHRFLSSDETDSAQISLAMNENDVSPVDPFLTRHRATQKLPPEPIRIENSVVLVQPYILPHYSKLGPLDLRK